MECFSLPLQALAREYREVGHSGLVATERIPPFTVPPEEDLFCPSVGHLISGRLWDNPLPVIQEFLSKASGSCQPRPGVQGRHP